MSAVYRQGNDENALVSLISTKLRLKTELESQLLRLHFNQNDDLWNTLPHSNFSVYRITRNMEGFSPFVADKTQPQRDPMDRFLLQWSKSVVSEGRRQGAQHSVVWFRRLQLQPNEHCHTEN
jgi:hypothetical protein